MRERVQRVALYARVSTTDKGQDIGLQLHDLREYCKVRDWQVWKEYIDDGISGMKDTRPQYQDLMREARRRRCDAIIIWRLDRLGRSLPHLVTTLQELQDLGVAFVSLKESLDFTTAAGRLMAHILASFAAFERDLLSERVKAGMENAKRKGKKVGRPPPLSPQDLEQIYSLHRQGLSCCEIAKQLDLSKSAVHKTVSNHGNGEAEITGTSEGQRECP
jgi:putative DNA-invertase from lambdoid prophage Rac